MTFTWSARVRFRPLAPNLVLTHDQASKSLSFKSPSINVSPTARCRRHGKMLMESLSHHRWRYRAGLATVSSSQADKKLEVAALLH